MGSLRQLDEGSEDLSAKAFLDKVLSNGFDGVEINFPDDRQFVDEPDATLLKVNDVPLMAAT